MNICWDPLCGEIFRFENDKRRNMASIGTNALHHCDPFLMPGLCLKFLTNIYVDNDSPYFFFTNGKPTFVHMYRFSGFILNSANTFLKSSNQCCNRSGEAALTRDVSIEYKWMLSKLRMSLNELWNPFFTDSIVYFE